MGSKVPTRRNADRHAPVKDGFQVLAVRMTTVGGRNRTGGSDTL